ncbi:MAG TPA: hypothetical protein VKV21_17920 [Solirubrobacteraceae bacterium]|nr:hypothetical protein [Solirubrobacteraceae bacterium]
MHRRRQTRRIAAVLTTAAALLWAGPALGRAPARGAGHTPGGSPAAGPLPAWAIGPFTRYAGNPILAPPADPTPATAWEFPSLFNPGVVIEGGVFHMLYRGATNQDYSEIGAATSTDGHHFHALTAPVIRHSLPSETHGVEDPRLYHLGRTYYSFFTGYNGTKIEINEAVSTDAVHWRQLGPVLHDNKDAAVVADPEGTPVKIGGHYLMYYGQVGTGAFLAESTNMTSWRTVGRVHLGFPASWKPWELCVAVTDYPTIAGRPVRTGIDLFVAGELMGHGRWFYAISQVDFTRGHLLRPVHVLRRPTLAPQAPYEIYGFTPHTVFTNDINFYRGRWWQYYGGGDGVVALANAPLRRR